MLTGRQIRAARAMLKWSGQKLARESRVSHPTIQRAEQVHDMPNMHARNLVAIQIAFERAGIEFVRDSRGLGVIQRE